MERSDTTETQVDGSEQEPTGASETGEDADKEENDAVEDGGRRKRRKIRKIPCLAGKPSLESVTEAEADKEAADKQSPTTCVDFGVRSYLHHFYESMAVRNPHLYEELSRDEDFQYLIKPRRRRCGSIWWKIGLWSGVNLVVFGLVAILVGYLVPQRPEVVDHQGYYDAISKNALRYNTNLDIFKLVGLIVFCIGGCLLAVSLLFPSFLYQWCEDDLLASEPFGISTKDTEKEPLSPTEKRVPGIPVVKGVQPQRDSNEAVLATKAGMYTVP
ncbi:PREDICTED: neurensin-1-like [Priapulus caudatus]|uniref:Neurensin-1-like n=1 Tax=Priapulus caudatus TaxID=37621 RepID=A0ABM1DPZ5_PRICU|nr:PREDICTED: neurensin-1-like [Priapulus caudatus]